jgi:hypothetical protein
MFELRVTVPSFSIFQSYWLGYGEISYVIPTPEGNVIVGVNYGPDDFRANCQAGRFGNGIYAATVTAY